MTSHYLRGLAAPYPALGFDWLRMSKNNRVLHGRQIQLDAQVAFLEQCRLQASEGLGQNIKLIPICHSGGGPRGTLWAVRHPEDVAGLVLIDVPLKPPRLPYSVNRVLMKLIWYWGLHPLGGLEGAFRAKFMELLGTYYFIQPTRELKETFTDAFASPFLPLLLESGFAKWDVHTLLSQIEVPVLIIHGKQDRLIPFEQVQEEKVRFSERITLALIEDAGHMPMLEQPLQTSVALQRFLVAHGLLLPENSNIEQPGVD